MLLASLLNRSSIYIHSCSCSNWQSNLFSCAFSGFAVNERERVRVCEDEIWKCLKERERARFECARGTREQWDMIHSSLWVSECATRQFKLARATNIFIYFPFSLSQTNMPVSLIVRDSVWHWLIDSSRVLTILFLKRIDFLSILDRIKFVSPASSYKREICFVFSVPPPRAGSVEGCAIFHSLFLYSFIHYNLPPPRPRSLSLCSMCLQ